MKVELGNSTSVTDTKPGVVRNGFDFDLLFVALSKLIHLTPHYSTKYLY